MHELDSYLSGEKLYGDDFGPDEIAAWHRDEQEAYADLGARDHSSYAYAYHALNWQLGFKQLPDRRFRNALGLGSAYGDEFGPIADRLDQLTILEPSDAFSSTEVHGVPCCYVKPTVDGSMQFEDGAFDLITCFGVLHHIPNVSTVLQEIYRCLETHGSVLLREPITSMGDWTRPRPGLTRRERGLPLPLFRKMIQNTGFRIQLQALCGFPLNLRLCRVLGIAIYNHALLTRFDLLCGRLLAWNTRYHPSSIAHKFRPAIAQFVLSKPR